MLQHLPDLFLGSVAPSAHRLLDLAGGILHRVQSVHHARRDRHSLRPPELQHTLHILSEKRSLDRHSSGPVDPDQVFYLPEDQLQAFGMILPLRQLQYAHFHQRNLIFVDRDQSVAHHDGAGVYTENNTGISLHKQMLLNKSTKIRINYLLGGLLSAGLLYLLYLQVTRQLSRIDPSAWWDHASNGYLAAALLLLPVNLALEARKWHMLAGSAAPLSYRDALVSYLAGLAFSVMTPNRIGEYPGRILFLRRKNTLRLISVSVLGIFAQLFAILFFGLCGLVYYNLEFPGFWQKIALAATLVALCGLGVLYLGFEKWSGRLFRTRPLRRFRVYSQMLRRFTLREQLQILGISLLRFLVFTAQYLTLLYWMKLSFPPLEGFLMAALFFWAMAVIPSVALAELGIRGHVSLVLFSHFSENTIGILAATMLLWGINLVLPSVAGSLLWLRVRIIGETAVTGSVTGR